MTNADWTIIGVVVGIIGIIVTIDISLPGSKIKSILGIGKKNEIKKFPFFTTDIENSSSKVVVLMGWLFIYPENIGPLRTAPQGTITGINNSKMYGYSNWRLPTKEELDILHTNASKINKFPIGNYLAFDRRTKQIYEYDLKNKGYYYAIYGSGNTSYEANVRLVRTEE